ncbi:potassium/proton antiporter [Campylobacter sp. 9BO]|uniref:potassium/proton antiporter n=1 Tax=Campylobacter sp. 9BO TaxID=3424759 RepID=UPI003D33DAB6
MENLLLFFAILLITSILASKFTDRLGIPSLLVFLGVGMLAGSDGLLGVSFDDQSMTQNVGMLALIFILYAGGLDTVFSSIKPVFSRGIILATAGVILTALALLPVAKFLLGYSWLEAFLLCAIISSTDAAAVFAVLKANNLSLKNNIGPLLELESGSNDPMAIFLTLTLIQIISLSQLPTGNDIALTFFKQFGIGAVLGYIFGILLPSIFNKIKLKISGLYPVFSVAWILLLYTVCAKLGGNGYLAVYMAGIFINKKEFVHKKNLIGFHDGIAWAMQLVVFLTLGLLVTPSELPSIALMAFLLALWLIFVARPIGVFVSLAYSRFGLKDKLFISWVGLRGVVPIVLATYTYGGGLEHANMIFNIIFFMVLISICLQGASIPYAARKFDVVLEEEAKQPPLSSSPILTYALKQFCVQPNSTLVGKSLAEINLPTTLLVIMIKRNNEYIKPTGSFIFEIADTLLIQCESSEIYDECMSKF